MNRESFASRIGFILMSAGCAIGLGNIWRFPYITGKYGGGLFVLIYFCFLVLLGFPVMVAELAVGRGGQGSLPVAMKKLGQPGNLWDIPANIVFLGNIILLMFYSVVTGWMLAYTWYYIIGELNGVVNYGSYFYGFLKDWSTGLFFAALGIFITVIVCGIGLRNGVEKVTKVMMTGLFVLQIIMIVQVLRLPGSFEGLKFLLIPDPAKIAAEGLTATIHAAMSQAFFTLSLGIGSIAICGSYTGKNRALSGEAMTIIVLDTIAAIASGLIIFPACFAFNVSPGEGPSLIFITLPKAFSAMSGGRLFGCIFFVFMSVAALSTLIAVAENIIARAMEQFGMSRIRTSALFGILLIVLSVPCVLGFNVWQRFQPLGKGTCVLDLEDFIVSSNLLPLGSVMILYFCTTSYGWKMENFLKEANTGKGMRFPRIMAYSMKYVLPIMILALWGYDIYHKFF